LAKSLIPQSVLNRQALASCANLRRRSYATVTIAAGFSKNSLNEEPRMARPSRLTVRFLGTHVDAEGIIGIAGAIVVVLVVLAKRAIILLEMDWHSAANRACL
jgi:hypothetical protein